MNRKKIILVTTIFTLISSITFAKDLPYGYKDISLGMSLKETKDALLKDSDFGYHGDRDVSLLPHSNKTLIETDATYGLGSNFLTNCYFQFTDDQLYIITININTERMDYYSVFTTLCNKYGEPDSISPSGAIWKNDSVTMSLEKPLTLKYVDNKLFDSVQNYSNVPKSATEVTREQFLDEL